MQADWIIYEDEILIAINKPSGLSTQGTEKSTKHNLYYQLQEFLDAREQKKTYLALHHRLDSATSGIIIFCKDKNYNKYISELFKNNQIKKTYLAVCEIIDQKSLQNTWTTNAPLIIFPFKHYKKSKISNKGKTSVTHFKLIKTLNNYALIECLPQTGRLHQIRVHLNSCQLPIVGDYHYNKNFASTPLMLHALKLEFYHPISKKVIQLEAKIPEYFLIFPN